MSSLRILVLVFIASWLLLPVTSSAQSVQPPCRFYGHVRLDGLTVPDGTVITAIIDGDIHTTKTPAIYGSSTYAIKIEPPSGTFYNNGTLITFKVGNYQVQETAVWEAGSNIFLNLLASVAPVSTPTSIPTPTPTPTPAPTASPPTATPSPTPTPTPTLISTLTPTPIQTIVPMYTPTPVPQTTNSVNLGKIIGLTFFSIVDVILVGLLIYLIWRFFMRPGEES